MDTQLNFNGNLLKAFGQLHCWSCQNCKDGFNTGIAEPIVCNSDNVSPIEREPVETPPGLPPAPAPEATLEENESFSVGNTRFACYRILTRELGNYFFSFL